MTENMKKFLEAVSTNEEMQKKLTNVTEKEEIIARAAELGIELTAADLEQKQELSDDELDAVAGGSGACACMAAGGGGGRENDRSAKKYGCACVAYGQGGNGSASDFNCFCFLGGFGEDNGF